MGCLKCSFQFLSVCRISYFLCITNFQSHSLLLREHILYSFKDFNFVEVCFLNQAMIFLCECGHLKKMRVFCSCWGLVDCIEIKIIPSLRLQCSVFLYVSKFLPSSSINCCEWGVKVPNYHFEFVYLSFQFYFHLLRFKALLFHTYTFKIAVFLVYPYFYYFVISLTISYNFLL